MPTAMILSPKGKYLAVLLKDKVIRIYDMMKGKNVASINESMKEITKIQEDSSDLRHSEYALEEGEFQKKISIEKDI